MKLLCGDMSQPETPKPKPSKGTQNDVICISDDEDDPPIKTEEALPSVVVLPVVFAEDETTMSLRELLQCLHSDELKKLAKTFKLKGSFKVRLTYSLDIYAVELTLRLAGPPHHRAPQGYLYPGHAELRCCYRQEKEADAANTAPLRESPNSARTPTGHSCESPR